MNPYNSTVFMPPQYNDESYFYYAFRSHVKFSIVVLFILVLLLSLLWNWQPWFKIRIEPVNKSPNATTLRMDGQDFERTLQSEVEFINYVVRPGDTLSEIAERFGVGLSVLLKHNGMDNPNAIRYGQRLTVPQRRNQ